MTLTGKDAARFEAFEKAGWENAAHPYHNHWGALSAQSASAMLDAARVSNGSRLLDVATGAGYLAAAAAERGAVAVGLDFSLAQVDLARRLYPNVSFQTGNAEALPFDEESFDAVVMGFGMNHLPNPEFAIHEAYRVLKSGGWFAFTVWAKPRDGEAFGIVLSTIEAESVPSPDLPPAPPYFRFADDGEVKSALEAAGFSKISTSIVPQRWRHSSPDQVFDAFHEGAVRATAMLKSQPEPVRDIIKRLVRDKVERLRVDDEFVIPVPAALSAGQKQ